MIDFDELRNEFVKSYMDPSRIYMIEHYLKTFDNLKKKNVPFMLFPRQKDLCELLGNANNIVTTKPRQAGITTTTAAFLSCTMALASPDSPETILVIGNKLDLSQQMVTKVREFLLQLPRWFYGDDYFSPDPDSDINKKDIFKKCSQSEVILFNGSRIIARSSGPNAARGVGGVSWLVFDEAAFIENGDKVYTTAVPTVSTGGHVIMISTPNGKDQLYYKTYAGAKAKTNSFKLIELKWYQDPRYNKNLEWYKVDKESGNVDIVKEPVLDKEGSVKYDPEHWVKMEEDGWKPRSPWYIHMCQTFNNDEQQIAQELDVSFLGSASNVVHPKYINMQEKLNVRDPDKSLRDPLVEETWVWKAPIEGHRYIMGIDCLPEGEEVMTDSGLKKIQDVLPEDRLVSKSGVYTGIVNFQRRSAVDEDVYTIHTYNVLRANRFTYKHPIWCSRTSSISRNYSRNDVRYRFNERYWKHNFEFARAEDVSEGDWLEIPNMYYGKDLSDEEILGHWSPEGVRSDFKIENPLLNEEFWWFVGIWLAEGWLEGNSIHTVHHIEEMPYVERIGSLADTVFNRKMNHIPHECTNSVTTYFSSKELASFLVNEFGKGAGNKHIPEWVKFLPARYKIKLIEGYFNGDGCITSQRGNIRIVSISYRLLEDVQDMLFSLRLISSVREMKTYSGNIIHGKKVRSASRKYEIQLGKSAACALLKMIESGSDEGIYEKEYLQYSYFSKDYKNIYLRVKKIDKEKYNGLVYNFETEDHTFCCKDIATHNCSRGDAADRTAIEIIDMDGRDEEDQPILEQVLEYHGKKTGDDIGEIAYTYGKMYGEAFTVIDCIGGTGDACILTMMRLGYKNLYYDDPNLKTYTMEREMSSMNITPDGKLPGFHSSSVRFQMLTNFADLIRKNALKIRSSRVILELDTWIYKGEAGRIDHMDGCHDDTLTCMAMAMFVMQFSLNKLQEVKSRDMALLQAYMTSNSRIEEKQESKVEQAHYDNSMPFYTNTSFNKHTSTDSYGWLIM